MPKTTLTLLCLLLTTAAIASCSSAPDEPHDPSALHVDRTGWDEDRKTLDDEIYSFLAGPNRLAEALAVSPDQLRVVTENKADRQQDLEQRLARLGIAEAEDDDGDIEVTAWSLYRIAQTYLNFGCELAGVETPDEIPSEMEPDFLASLEELAVPLLEQSFDGFVRVLNFDISPWSEAAEFVVETMESQSDQVAEPLAPTRAVCEKTADFWRSETGDDEAPEVADGDKSDAPDQQGDSIFVYDGDGDDLLDAKRSIQSEEEKAPDADADDEDETIPKVATIQFGEPDVEGSCSSDDVTLVFESRDGGFENCYEREVQQNPELSGTLTVDWQIEPGGAISNIDIAESSIDHEDLEQCVAQITRRMRFSAPEDDEPCQAQITMEFSDEVENDED